MLPTEAEAFLGLPGMEFWISPAACDEVSGNSDLSGSQELLPQELEDVMCSERIEKITKTYHDIDAVTTLLEEKEHDLELAARIGQSLLKQNRSLSERNEFLDEQLELAKEEVAQLRHEISMRDDLLRMFTNNTEDSEPTSIISTPLRRNDSSLSLQQCLQYDLLQQKLKALEEENQKLRTEATNIATETYEYEDQEQKLMLDCVEQFSDTSQQIILISEELALKTEDSIRQQEEISQLLAQIVEQQQKCRAYCSEVEQLQQQLSAAKEIQSQLRRELQDSQEKYTECQAMLHEAQEDIKDLRNRSLPNSTIHHSSPTFLPLDSLAAEIKSTMRKGMDSSGSSEYKSFRRVFETVKAVKRAIKSNSGRATPLGLPPHFPKAASVACSRFGTPRNNHYGSDSPIMLEEKGHLAPEDLDDAHHSVDATSGTPGHHVLEAAIQSLSARQQNHSTEHSFFEMERECKLKRLAWEAEDFSGCLTPNGSITSIGTNYSGSSGTSLGSYSCFPDKLQIVKPMEGSVTLHHWQQLARPHLAGILDPRPGVLTKDFRQLDTDLEEVHNLNDLEEDDLDGSALSSLATSTPVKAKERPTVFHSVNNLPQTPPTFTITTCCIMHPIKEVTMVTPSLYNTVVPSCGPCMGLSPSSPPQPPLQARRRQEKKEKELGLVTLLTKRGISAQSQGGALVSPPRVIRDPSLSSCFPPSLVSRCHYRSESFADWTSGLRSLQRKKPEKSPNSIFSLNLVEKLQQLGLDKVLARGEASYITSHQQELRQGKECLSGLGDQQDPVGPQ
ncbi:trafficking kinesin-binding protein 1-like [Vipera latastei]